MGSVHGSKRGLSCKQKGRPGSLLLALQVGVDEPVFVMLLLRADALRVRRFAAPNPGLKPWAILVRPSGAAVRMIRRPGFRPKSGKSKSLPLRQTRGRLSREKRGKDGAPLFKRGLWCKQKGRPGSSLLALRVGVDEPVFVMLLPLADALRVRPFAAPTYWCARQPMKSA